jgi:hypothetical protein
MKRKGLSALGLGLALLAAAPAQAVSTAAFQDDDNDFLWRPGVGLIAPNTCNGPGDPKCQIQANDVLIAVFDFNTWTINGVNQTPNSGSGGLQVTGISAIQWTDGTIVNDPNFGPQRVWQPFSDGLNSILGIGGLAPVTNGGAGQGAMVALYRGTANLQFDTALSPNTPTCSSLADCIARGGQTLGAGGASVGSLLQVDGIRDPNDFWRSGTGGADIFNVWNLSSQQTTVGVSFGLSSFFNSFGPVGYQDLITGAYRPDCFPGNVLPGCVQFAGQATVNGGTTLGNQLPNGAFANSTTITGQKYIVPEPGSLALLASAVFAAAGFSRRKR